MSVLEMDNLPYGLVIAMAAGLFGASFFMLIELQNKLGRGDTADLREMWAWRFLLLRCIVGVGAASILYFFFRCGLLEGTLGRSSAPSASRRCAAPASGT